MWKTKRLKKMEDCRKDGKDWPYTKQMTRKRKAERRKIKEAAEVLYGFAKVVNMEYGKL